MAAGTNGLVSGRQAAVPGGLIEGRREVWPVGEGDLELAHPGEISRLAQGSGDQLDPCIAQDGERCRQQSPAVRVQGQGAKGSGVDRHKIGWLEAALKNLVKPGREASEGQAGAGPAQPGDPLGGVGGASPGGFAPQEKAGPACDRGVLLKELQYLPCEAGIILARWGQGDEGDRCGLAPEGSYHGTDYFAIAVHEDARSGGHLI
jgi:hypothetical protein